MYKIELIILRTILTVEPSLKRYLQTSDDSDNKSVQDSLCFEILGFDVLIDSKLRPWLLEVNHAPSFGADTPLDFKLKKDLIADTLQVLNMSFKNKKKVLKEEKKGFNTRMMNSPRERADNWEEGYFSKGAKISAMPTYKMIE